MSYSSNAYCRYCNKLIGYERTVNGKNMPVDIPRVNYYPDPNGKDTILNGRGETVRGIIDYGDAPGSKKGWVPHFISCVKYKRETPPPRKEPKKEPDNQMSLFGK